MNYMSDKFKGFLRKIRANKRLTYLTLVSVLVLFCLALNVTFSVLSSNYNGGGANISVNNLKYRMIINEVELDGSVGKSDFTNTIIGDRVILLKAGKSEIFELNLISLNNIDTKYEVIYNVCADVNCTSFIDTSSDIEIKYEADTPYVSGEIKAEKSKTLSLITTNNSDKDYYVLVGLNAGYSHNELTLTNQINSSYSSNDVTIVAYVDGVEMPDFPTTSNYLITSECSVNGAVDSNVTVKGKWVSNHWKLIVDNVIQSKTVCNVTFVEVFCTNYAPCGWDVAASGTLLAGIKANYNVPTEPLTTPGQEVSAEDEAVMAAAEDDYGTSYYFRGNVQNNYVAFAGMCWRIVRITGDGSIKLVLYNYSSDDCSITGDDLAFARYSGTTYKTAFNTSYNNNAYIGFMYGSATGSTYAATQENKNKSIILTNLETWYENNLASYADDLADTIWCNDKSTSDLGYGRNASYYGTYERYESSTPNLKCPDDKDGGNLSRFTVEATDKGNGALDYKIGLLTVDEMVYAGLKWDTLNSNSNYLKENVGSDTKQWSLSPCLFDGGYAYVWAAGGVGNVGGYFVYNSYGLRPSVSLKNASTISGGNGTAESPFVVN